MDDLDFLDFPSAPPASKPNPVETYRAAADALDAKHAASLVEGAQAIAALHDALKDEDVECKWCGKFDPNVNADGECATCAAPAAPEDLPPADEVASTPFYKALEAQAVDASRAFEFGPIVPPDAAPPEQPVAREDKPVDRLGLPAAAVRVLMRNGFETLGDLRARRLDLPSLRGIGSKSLDAINAALDADGATPGVEAVDVAAGADVTRTVVVSALPVVVTIGAIAMRSAPDNARVLDLDDIVGDAPNAVEVIAAFLAATPFDQVAPTRLHARAAAPYVDALLDWARSAGVMVFGNV
jgi:hypothetical protein